MLNPDNLCNYTGNLTRDPEFFEAKDDKTAFVKFTVAVNRLKDERADFIDCVAWGRAAETIATFCKKGSKINVVGAMECDPYEAKDGTKRYPFTLKVDAFRFRGKKADSETNPEFTPNFEEVTENIPF